MKSVLLFSGGLDSFCSKKILEPDKLLYVDMNTEESKQEIENLEKMPFEVEVDKIPLEKYELANKIIPYRNHFLALVGAQYANKVYFGFTAGDTTKDKDYVFKSQIEGILNYFSLDEDKVRIDEYPYEVKMPFKNLTKTEILSKYLNEGGTKEELKLSRSCYEGEEKECGQCRSCLRKAVAYELNDLSYENIFEKNPFENISEADHRKMKSRKKEGEEYLKALRAIK